jgi:hypothetical protein
LSFRVRSLHSRPGMTSASNCSSLDRISPSAADLPVVLICRSRQRCDDGQITGTFPRILCPITRGVSRSSRTLGQGDAVDAKRATDDCACRGRRSRGVLISRRWYQVGDDADALRWRWWQESPITRETTKETVKPPRRECWNVSGEPVANACVFSSRKTTGAASGVDLTFANPSREFVKRMPNPKLH